MQPHQVIFDIYLKKEKKCVCSLLYKTFRIHDLITDNFEQKLGLALMRLFISSPEILFLFSLQRGESALTTKGILLQTLTPGGFFL